MVERDAVAARLGDLRDVALGVRHHQVAVEGGSPLVDERRDRPQDDRPDRHGLDEVAVPDVEMEDADARVEERSTCSPRRAKSAA